MLEATPLLTVGQRFNALACLRDAVGIDLRLLGPRDPTTAAAAATLADLLDQAHKADEAAAVRADAGIAPPPPPPTTTTTTGATTRQAG